MVSLAILAVGFQLISSQSPPVTVHGITATSVDTCDHYRLATHDDDSLALTADLWYFWTNQIFFIFVPHVLCLVINLLHCEINNHQDTA